MNSTPISLNILASFCQNGTTDYFICFSVDARKSHTRAAAVLIDEFDAGQLQTPLGRPLSAGGSGLEETAGGM